MLGTTSSTLLWRRVLLEVSVNFAKLCFQQVTLFAHSIWIQRKTMHLNTSKLHIAKTSSAYWTGWENTLTCGKVWTGLDWTGLDPTGLDWTGHNMGRGKQTPDWTDDLSLLSLLWILSLVCQIGHYLLNWSLTYYHRQKDHGNQIIQDIFNRPGVAGAVLWTALSLTD